jgi:hypothetical protein
MTLHDLKLLSSQLGVENMNDSGAASHVTDLHDALEGLFEAIVNPFGQVEPREHQGQAAQLVLWGQWFQRQEHKKQKQQERQQQQQQQRQEVASNSSSSSSSSSSRARLLQRQQEEHASSNVNVLDCSVLDECQGDHMPNWVIHLAHWIHLDTSDWLNQWQDQSLLDRLPDSVRRWVCLLGEAISTYEPLSVVPINMYAITRLKMCMPLLNACVGSLLYQSNQKSVPADLPVAVDKWIETLRIAEQDLSGELQRADILKLLRSASGREHTHVTIFSWFMECAKTASLFTHQTVISREDLTSTAPVQLSSVLSADRRVVDVSMRFPILQHFMKQKGLRFDAHGMTVVGLEGLSETGLVDKLKGGAVQLLSPHSGGIGVQFAGFDHARNRARGRLFDPSSLYGTHDCNTQNPY